MKQMTIITKKKYKIFISQPMTGKSKEEILEKRKQAEKEIHKLLGENVEILNSYIEMDNPDKTNQMKGLAKALEVMAEADGVYFVYGWMMSTGCRCEHYCAIEYGKDIYHEGTGL